MSSLRNLICAHCACVLLPANRLNSSVEEAELFASLNCTSRRCANPRRKRTRRPPPFDENRHGKKEGVQISRRPCSMVTRHANELQLRRFCRMSPLLPRMRGLRGNPFSRRKIPTFRPNRFRACSRDKSREESARGGGALEISSRPRNARAY